MSSLCRPLHRLSPKGGLVEAPGTAPGSTTLIPRIVYRHSRPRLGTPYIGRDSAAVLGGWHAPDRRPDRRDRQCRPEATAQTRRATVPALEARLFEAIPLLDHGFLRCIDYMGDDAAIVQAARVSLRPRHTARVRRCRD